MKTILNFLYLLISKGAGLILFTIITPLLIKKIGINGLGQISIVIAFAYIFDAFVEYSFSVTILKDIAENINNIKKKSSIFFTTLFAKFFLLIISLIIGIIIIFLNDKYYNFKELFLCSFIFIFARSIMPVWYCLGVEKMQGITIVSLISKILYFLSIWFFIHNNTDLFKVILFWGLSEFFPSLFFLIWIILKDKLGFEKPNIEKIFALLKRDFMFSVSLFFFRIYVSLPILILGQVCDNFIVGIFSVADKIIAIIKDTIGLLFNSLLPRVIKIYNQENRKALVFSLKITFFFSFLYILGLFILNYFADFIVLYFTKNNISDIKNILLILSFSCIFILIRLPSSIYIVIKRLDKLFTFTILFCTFISIFVTYFLTKNFFVIGTSYAILIIEILISSILIWKTFINFKSEIYA